jgi:hypothetical protein
MKLTFDLKEIMLSDVDEVSFPYMHQRVFKGYINENIQK